MTLDPKQTAKAVSDYFNETHEFDKQVHANKKTENKFDNAQDKQNPIKDTLQNIAITAFAPFFDRLMQHEGGYVNHPNDPGGETKWGVTKRVARQYGYKGSMKKLPKATANKIAEQLYWDKVRGGELDKAIAWQVLDASYNHGVKRAVKFLQKAVGVPADGMIGDVTIKAVQARDKNDVILCFNAERLEFYARLRTFRTFGRGWTRRVAGNLRFASKDN